MATSDNDVECQTEFLQEVSLDSTIDIDSETTCAICHAEFLDAEDLKIHMEQVHSTRSNKTDVAKPKQKGSNNICQFCDTTYTDLDEYARHIATKHLKSLFCCEVCKKCFSDEMKLKKHEKKHKYKSAFACTQCTAMFNTELEVAAHENVFHNNNNDGLFITCLPHLSSYLKFNIQKFLESKEKVLECHSCSVTKSTTSADIKSYLKHLDNCAGDAFVCDMCCYVSKDKKTLINHLFHKFACKYPMDIVSSTTKCKKCAKNISCKEMGTHLDVCTNYKCYTCNMQFESIPALSAHQSEVHPVELDLIKCKFCSKEYVGQVSLDKHIKRSHGHHLHLYKYACKTCDAIFKHPQALFAHYFRIHRELQPYTCKICNQTFRIRKRFTIHIKLEHKGTGVVEFDENYHVFFASQKSDNPFVPKCVIPEMVALVNKKYKNKNDEMTTEVETEVEEPVKAKPKPKTRGRKRKRDKVLALSSSDEEEAENLLTLKKRAERRHFLKQFGPRSTRPMTTSQRKQITCKVCNKYCYTVQNYQNHIKTHTKDKSFACIKCSKSFKSKNELTKHMNEKHATSKLIETLKNVLERKQNENVPNNSMNDTTVPDNYETFEKLSMSERFQRTIKKVKFDKQNAIAKISPSSGTISVKNFLESFDPDPTDSPKVSKFHETEPVVTIKEHDSPFYRKRSIKLTRFVLEQPPTEIRLRMPEKFKSNPFYDNQKVKLNVRMVNETFRPSTFLTFENVHNYDTYEENHDNNDYHDRNDTIPEVAQEVMLEETEEPPKRDKPDMQGPHKIVIPKLPAGYNKIHIATLQPQAPYFKIITVRNEQNSNAAIVIDPQKTDKPGEKKQKELPQFKEDVISLPDGTKFVSANPLQHLLGDRPVSELLKPVKNKYYNPAPKNIKGLLADALQNLENGNHRVRKRKIHQTVDKTGQKKPGPKSKTCKAKKMKQDELREPENSVLEISERQDAEITEKQGTDISERQEAEMSETNTAEVGKSLPIL